MTSSLKAAFKEWAVICRALQVGRQSLIVRKGGIAEEFTLEAKEFLLYPTFTHQQETGIRAEAVPLLDDVKRTRPAAGRVRLEAWAKVTGVYQVHDLLPAHMIAHLHLWSDDAVAKRFHYRTPGINVLAVRVYRLPAPVEIAEEATYAGCKSWVPLANLINTADSTPVLSDREYHDVVNQLDTLLRPTALA